MDKPTQRLSRLQGHLQPQDEPFARRTTLTIERLKAERSRATFPVREMTYFLDGGEDITAIKEGMMEELGANPVFNDPEWHDITRAQVRERTLRRVRAAYRLLVQDGADVVRRNCRLEIHSLHDLGWYVRQGVHFGLFMSALAGQGSEEQRAEWLPKTMMCEIYGCFGMTELGHGSFLRGLETTARFDKDTQEFVINTPTDTATKWWIGAAGQTATHAVVFARLLLEEGDVGVHNFIVPVRDMETHRPLPGVHIGDVGAKMGLNGIDNGWMQFDHVRVPHENMLCRYAQVTPEGRYIKPPRKEMAYGALIGTRAALIKTAVDFQKKALMIAVRYAAMRVQGTVEDSGKGEEVALLDYPIHQHKLLTLLAAAYAWHFQASFVLRLNDKLEEGLAAGDLSILNDVHGTMAGLKAFGTWHTYHCTEVCRQSLGGHGYSKYNGLSGTMEDFAVMCTWEGDNTVMALQTGRYLVRSFEKAKKGEKLSGSVAYLQTPLPPRWSVSSPADLLEPRAQRQAWNSLLATRVAAVASRVLDRQAAVGVARGFKDSQVDLFNAAKLHVSYNVAMAFMDAVEEARASHPALAPVLKRLCDAFSLDKLLEEAAGLLESGFADASQIRMARDQLQELLISLRPDAVALVDAFNYSDVVLGSFVGAADGDIYSRYLQHVQKRVPENLSGGTPYFESEIKPFISGEDLINT